MFMKSLLVSLCLIVFACVGSAQVTTTFSGTGNWTDAGRWNNGIPGVSDSVLIANGANCTINTAANCRALTILNGSTNTTVTISGSNSLNITRSLNFLNPGRSGITKRLNVNAGTLTAGSMVMANNTSNSRTILSITTGSADINGLTDFNGSSSAENRIEITSSGRIYYGGTVEITTYTASYSNSSTVIFDAPGTQTIPAATYHHLTIPVTATKTASGTLNINGILNNSGTLNMGTYLLSGTLSNAGTGTIRTQNSSTSPIPSGVTWINTVIFDRTNTQSIQPGTYSNLSVINSGTKTARGNITVTGLLTYSTTFNMSAYKLDGVFTTAGTGTLQTTNNSTSPLPSGVTWVGTVSYTNSTTNQTIVSGSYMNLIASSATAGTRTLQNTDTIYIRGNFTRGSIAPFATAGSVVKFNGTVTQNITMSSGSPATFNDLVVATKDTLKNNNREVIILNNLVINAGSIYNLRNSTLNVTGTTLVNGTLYDDLVAGTIILGKLTVNGTYKISSNNPVTIRNGISNQGIFTPGTGAYTFSTNHQEIVSNTPITFGGNMVISGAINLTNKTSIQITGNLTANNANGTFINDSYSTLKVNGSLLSAMGVLTASAPGNTVEYNNAGSQTAKNIRFYHLIKSGAGNLTVNGSVRIDKNFTLNAGRLTLTGAAAAITGTDSGLFTVGSGVTVVIGNNGENNPIQFPAGFTDNHIQLHATSTLIYGAGHVSQTIRNGIPYGNLTVNTGLSPRTITINDLKFVVQGNFILNNNIDTGIISIHLNCDTVDINGSISGTGNLLFNHSKIFLAGSNTLSGELTTITSDIALDGSAAQVIRGDTFTSMHVNNAAGITLSSETYILDELEIQTGGVVSNGFLTLVSDSIGTARIAEMPSGTYISGAVTVERFIQGGENLRKWRFLAAPVSGVSIEASWQDSIHITGQGSGGSPCPSFNKHSNGFDATDFNSPSLQMYSETNGRWETPSGTSNTLLEPGKGYNVLVRGKRSDGCDLLTLLLNNTSSVTIRAKGTLHTGQLTVPLTRTNSKGKGFNLVGNPYASDIDWNHPDWVAARGSNISPGTYVYNPKSASYSNWHPVGGSVNGGSPVIESGQGFFALANGNTNLVFEEKYKLRDDSHKGFFGKSGVSNNNNVKITLADTGRLDETVVYLHQQATKGFNILFDMTKAGYGNQTIASFVPGDTTRYVFNGIGIPSTTDTVALCMRLPATNKSFSLNFANGNWSSGTTATLVDKYLNTTTDITNGYQYPFNTTTANPLSYGEFRFYMVISPGGGSLPVTLVQFAGYQKQNEVYLHWQTSSEVNTSHFIVEKSNDGKHFEEMETIKAAGNSSSLLEYKSTGIHIRHGKNYFRLRIADKNGSYEYSEVLVFEKEEDKTNGIVLYPNPSNAEVVLTNPDKLMLQIRITDLTGKEIKHISCSDEEINLASAFATKQVGIYTVHISTDGGKSIIHKLIRYE